jgi:hypothetical protein
MLRLGLVCIGAAGLVLTMLSCGESVTGGNPTNNPLDGDPPDYGVWGYVLLIDGTPILPGDVVTVTCSCGEPGAQWLSTETDEDGYWEVAFNEAEADAHDGHGMDAWEYFMGDHKEFTFEKPVTGPVVIICLNE